MKLCLSIVAVLVFVVASVSDSLGQTVLLSDQMDVGTGWTYSHIGGTAQPIVGDIAEADFGFDYSAFGIPEAPNSDVGDTATSGLRLATNITGFFGGTSVAAVFEDVSFTGQYTLQVDAWLNWSPPLGVGSTEHAGVYVGFDTVAAQATNFSGQSGAGFTLDTDGDCGNCDYILNKDVAELDLFSGQYFTGGTGFPGNQPGVDNTDGPFPAFFPSFDIGTATGGVQGPGTQPAGAAGLQWVTITAEVDTNAVGSGTGAFAGTAGLATFTITNPATGQSQLIGTVDNSVEDDPLDGQDTQEAPANMSGAIGLSLIDFFNGGPVDPSLGFTVFDNVRVFDGFLASDNADFDGSGIVDGVDFLIFQRGVGLVGQTDNSNGDADGSGTIDAADLAVWQTQYGAAPPLTASIASVPEPASAMLLMLGCTGLLIRRRR